MRRGARGASTSGRGTTEAFTAGRTAIRPGWSPSRNPVAPRTAAGEGFPSPTLPRPNAPPRLSLRGRTRCRCDTCGRGDARDRCASAVARAVDTGSTWRQRPRRAIHDHHGRRTSSRARRARMPPDGPLGTDHRRRDRTTPPCHLAGPFPRACAHPMAFGLPYRTRRSPTPAMPARIRSHAPVRRRRAGRNGEATEEGTSRLCRPDPVLRSPVARARLAPRSRRLRGASGPWQAKERGATTGERASTLRHGARRRFTVGSARWALERALSVWRRRSSASKVPGRRHLRIVWRKSESTPAPPRVGLPAARSYRLAHFTPGSNHARVMGRGTPAEGTGRRAGSACAEGTRLRRSARGGSRRTGSTDSARLVRSALHSGTREGRAPARERAGCRDRGTRDQRRPRCGHLARLQREDSSPVCMSVVDRASGSRSNQVPW